MDSLFPAYMLMSSRVEAVFAAAVVVIVAAAMAGAEVAWLAKVVVAATIEAKAAWLLG